MSVSYRALQGVVIGLKVLLLCTNAFLPVIQAQEPECSPAPNGHAKPPPYLIIACSLVKHELFLGEYIIRTLMAGYDHIHILDNNHVETWSAATYTLVEPFIASGHVTYHNFSQVELPQWGRPPRQDPRMWCAHKFKHTARWVSLQDVDEFLVVRGNRTLAEVLKRHYANPAIGGVEVQWKQLYDSHFRYSDFKTFLLSGDGLVCGDNATHFPYGANRHPKTLFPVRRNNAAWPLNNPPGLAGPQHFCNCNTDALHAVLPNGAISKVLPEFNRPPPNPQYDDSVLFWAHAYSRGSIEGWLMKVHHAYKPGGSLYDDMHMRRAKAGGWVGDLAKCRHLKPDPDIIKDNARLRRHMNCYYTPKILKVLNDLRIASLRSLFLPAIARSGRHQLITLFATAMLAGLDWDEEAFMERYAQRVSAAGVPTGLQWYIAAGSQLPGVHPVFLKQTTGNPIITTAVSTPEEKAAQRTSVVQDLLMQLKHANAAKLFLDEALA